MDSAKYASRVGGVAVAAWVGMALATWPGVALADAPDPKSPDSTNSLERFVERFVGIGLVRCIVFAPRVA